MKNIVVATDNRSIWGYLFDHSMTIDMARDSTVPVLALAEKTENKLDKTLNATVH